MKIYRGKKSQRQEEDELSTSPYSGFYPLAPPLSGEIRLKRGIIGNKEYKDQYFKKLDKSFQENKDKLDFLFNRDRLILTCYCEPTDETCHNKLLIEYITNKYSCVKYGGIWEENEEGYNEIRDSRGKEEANY